MLGSVNTPKAGGGVVAQATPPTNTNMLWIDTANGGVSKYYDKDTKTWKFVGGGVAVQSTAPSNTNSLWIDTANGNIAKYYNKSTSTWKTIASTWS